ncbi:MAG TPA: hypothetical protein DIT01_11305 [Lentisphaeria bacterium]|nr:hypothetical protein [Lentisphaeria bacterium]
MATRRTVRCRCSSISNSTLTVSTRSSTGVTVPARSAEPAAWGAGTTSSKCSTGRMPAGF